MTREEDIRATLRRSREVLEKIKAEYDRSLKDQRVSSDLKLDIKALCGDLRSVLDYLAHDVRDSMSTTTGKQRFYFPILNDRKSYEQKMSEWFPNLENQNRTLWDYLESIQPYQSGCEWLGQFNEVNNENKHNKLIEQTRTERQEIVAKSTSGSEVRWNPSSVRFGSGVQIGGVPVDPRTQMPVPSPQLDVKRIIWVDFRFDGVNTSALGLLNRAIAGISQIVEKVTGHLGGQP